MRIDIESLINLVGNGILIFIIEIYYRRIERKGVKANKYIDEEELKESIFNFIDKVGAYIPWWIIIFALNGRYPLQEMSILKKWGYFLGIVSLFFIVDVFLRLCRKKLNVSYENQVPDCLQKLMYIYEFDEGWKRFFLSEKSIPLVKAGKWLKIAYLFYFEIFYDFTELLDYSVSVAIYPIFLLILLGKINSFLDAYTAEQYCEKVLHSNTERVRNPRIVIVSDKVVCQLKKFKLSVECEYRSEEDEISCEEESNEYEHNLLENFLKGRNREEYKEDYLFNPTVNLLKKQSVIFNTFFYRDLELAVFFPMMLAAFKEKKSLVIMEEPDYKEEKKWVESSIEKMCGIYDYILCSGIREADGSENIFIVTYQEIVQWKENAFLKKIAGQIELMFLVEPSSQTMQNLEEINNFKIFAESFGEDINIIISDSHQEIAERMLSISDGKTIYKGPYYWMPRQYSAIVWDADSKENQEFGSKDIETNIIHILKKKADKGEIFWINQNVCPSVDLWWYYQKYMGQLDRIEIKHMETGRELKVSQEAYYIVEDGENNFLRMKERFLSRAEEKGFVCIISPNYLLRNYLIQDKTIKESVKNNIKDIILSETPITLRNVVIDLIKKLYQDYVKEEDIRRSISAFAEDIDKVIDIDKNKEIYKDIHRVIEMLINFYFSNWDVKVELKENEIGRKRYKIKEDSLVYEFIQQETELSVYREKEVLREKFGVCYHTVFQKYLPGQNIIFNGRQYLFSDILFEEGKYKIDVKRNLNKGEKREYYRQVREYNLTFTENPRPCLQLYEGGHGIYMERRQFNINCTTLGYIKMPRFNDFYHGVYTSVRGVDIRMYQNKEVLRIKIPRADSVVHMYFAIILREILYTLCPEDIDYLGVGIQVGCENELIKEYINRGIIWQVTVLQKEENCIYILEDSVNELGILQDLQQKMVFIVDLIVSYVEWYIQSDDDYLLFGAEDGTKELKQNLNSLLEKIYYRFEEQRKEVQESGLGNIAEGVENRESIKSEGTNVPKEKKEIISEREAKSIFSEVLVDMFYFRDLNVNIALELRLKGSKMYKLRDNAEKRKKDKEFKKRNIKNKKRIPQYIDISRNMGRKEFYYKCAFEIIKAYNASIKGGLTEEDCEKYAKDYVELIFT